MLRSSGVGIGGTWQSRRGLNDNQRDVARMYR